MIGIVFGWDFGKSTSKASVLPNKALSNKKRILNKNTNKIFFFISNKFLFDLFLFFILEYFLPVFYFYFLFDYPKFKWKNRIKNKVPLS